MVLLKIIFYTLQDGCPYLHAILTFFFVRVPAGSFTSLLVWLAHTDLVMWAELTHWSDLGVQS